MTKRTLKSIPPEPWGSRIRRAREDVAGLTNEQAVEGLHQYASGSASTISRLEHSPSLPAQRRTREKATLLCYVYGVDPKELELDPDELPPMLRKVTPGGGRTPLSPAA